ncbi:hypothetical protein [Mangrovihabitans endophyticus]|uniref:Uncharacterized protein n=1 Tax=Mangrovihabitans endophyticus TaxID=1751298 RepID=A0A8J3C2I1_9ACTN|nr:hypothetical protein [Mangrovihabitans endophyticus]GGL00615.1 hypothetical protein GCM10012284_38880 [Mangrovihabitans endophyticus]
MGFLERRADGVRRAADGADGVRRPADGADGVRRATDRTGDPRHQRGEGRYGLKPGPAGGSNDPLFDPTRRRAAGVPPPGGPAQTAAPDLVQPDLVQPDLVQPEPVQPEPVQPEAAPAVRPADLTDLLGSSVLHDRTQRICRAYGLLPPAGFRLSRSYQARDVGVEIAADAHGTITAVFLHFHGDDGFAHFAGEMPGAGGVAPRRAALWANLGRPQHSGDPQRDRFLGDHGPWDRWVLASHVLRAQYDLDGESLLRLTLTPPPRG